MVSSFAVAPYVRSENPGVAVPRAPVASGLGRSGVGFLHLTDIAARGDAGDHRDIDGGGARRGDTRAAAVPDNAGRPGDGRCGRGALLAPHLDGLANLDVGERESDGQRGRGIYLTR